MYVKECACGWWKEERTRRIKQSADKREKKGGGTRETGRESNQKVITTNKQTKKELIH